MEKGLFTESEISYLVSLDAVERVDPLRITYAPAFKKEFIERYEAGEKPRAIFESAGLYVSLIGYKRIERACAHWREAKAKDALCLTPDKIPSRDDIRSRERKRAAIRLAATRASRERQIAQMEEKMVKQKARSEREKEKIIAQQAAKIAALESQVKALKANGTFAKKTKRAPGTTEKSERFELIFQLKSKSPSFNVSAACEALEVSRRGYYDWIEAIPDRQRREEADRKTKAQVEIAFSSHGAKKGSREIVDSLRREQGLVVNRKKVQRIMRKFDIVYSRKRKNPYHPIGVDGQPKVADNVLDRDFHQGLLRKVLATDITYIPCKEGFTYLSVIIDAQNNEVLSYVPSLSLEMEFVLETFDKIKEMQLDKGVVCQSDQGSHYTSRAYRKKLQELGIRQSMSRRACCWDNACVESFFGRMKSQIGSTKECSYKEICDILDEYMDYYNNCRGQARLGWLSPKEYAAVMLAA